MSERRRAHLTLEPGKSAGGVRRQPVRGKEWKSDGRASGKMGVRREDVLAERRAVS